VPPSLVPEGKLDTIPESEFVVDDANTVFYHVLSDTETFCNVGISQTLGDKVDELPFAFIQIG
jgi:hypothetical protein